MYMGTTIDEGDNILYPVGEMCHIEWVNGKIKGMLEGRRCTQEQGKDESDC